MNKLTRRDINSMFLVPFVPESQTEMYEAAHADLGTIRKQLLSGNRVAAKTGAEKIRHQLLEDATKCAARIRAYCADILRDCGAPNFITLDRLHRQSEVEWASQHDYLHLSWALLGRAEMYRHQKEFSRAMTVVNGVLDLLDGRCRREDPLAVLLLRYEALRLKQRLVWLHAGELDHAEPIVAEMKSVAKEICSPFVDLQTLGENISYYTAWRRRRHAEEYVVEAKRKLIPFHNSLTHVSVLRAEIQFLRTWQKREVPERVEEHLGVWLRNPNLIQLGDIQDIRAEYGMSPIRSNTRPIQFTTFDGLYRNGLLTKL